MSASGPAASPGPAIVSALSNHLIPESVYLRGDSPDALAGGSPRKAWPVTPSIPQARANSPSRTSTNSGFPLRICSDGAATSPSSPRVAVRT